MLKPQRFAMSNRTMGPPEGWTDEECNTIHAFAGKYGNDKPVMITAWRPAPEDLVRLNAGEPLWLHICMADKNGNATMPPVLLDTKDPWD